MNRWKRIAEALCGLVLLCVICFVFEVKSAQAGVEIIQSVTLKDSLTWTLNGDGVLEVSGTGRMMVGNSDEWRKKFEKSVEKVIVREGVTSICDEAFYGFKNLKSVVLPESLERIGLAAFGQCRRLTDIKLPDGITSIDESAFQGCTGLKQAVLPKGIREIDSEIFGDCSSLSYIRIPDGVTCIGTSAFDGCSSLREVVIPDSVTIIKDFAFRDCRSLKRVTLPEHMTRIGWDVFVRCSSLTCVTIPESIPGTGTKGDLFRNSCRSLKEIYYGGSKTRWKNEIPRISSNIPAGVKIYYAREDRPELDYVRNTAKGVEVSWHGVDGVKKYRVYYRAGSGSWKKAGDVSAGKKGRYMVTGLKSGREYSFTVRGLTANKKKFSTGFDKIGQKIRCLAAPSIKASRSTEGVTVRWKKVPGASGYEIYRKNSSGWIQIGRVTSGNTVRYTDKTAKKGKKYTYSVCAYTENTESGYAKEVTVR